MWEPTLQLRVHSPVLVLPPPQRGGRPPAPSSAWVILQTLLSPAPGLSGGAPACPARGRASASAAFPSAQDYHHHPHPVDGDIRPSSRHHLVSGL